MGFYSTEGNVEDQEGPTYTSIYLQVRLDLFGVYDKFHPIVRNPEALPGERDNVEKLEASVSTKERHQSHQDPESFLPVQNLNQPRHGLLGISHRSVFGHSLTNSRYLLCHSPS